MGYTGPYEFVETTIGSHKQTYSYRSIEKPYREVLPYYTGLYVGVNKNNMTGVSQPSIYWGSPAMQWGQSVGTDPSSRNYAQAYDRFWNSVTKESGTASMGVTLAEYKSSLTMISARSQQLITAIAAIKRGNYHDLARALNVAHFDRRGRTIWRKRDIRKAPANQLLEYTFGWVPLVNDVRAACKVLSSTPELLKVYASSSSEDYSEEGTQLENLPNYVRWVHRINRKVVLKGDVRIDNPNLDLANRLGLVNPIQLAWNVIPYSFLVDNFVGVSEFLGRFSADFGRSLENGAWSEKVSIRSTRESRAYILGQLYESSTFVERMDSFRRTPRGTFARPTALPILRLPVSHLLGRAVTTTALLLQQLQRSGR